MRYIPLHATLAAFALTLGTVAASAQPAPPPAAPPIPGTDDGTPPPPMDGPKGGHPAPPPPGASVHVERGPTALLRVDVHCGPRETTSACADIASQLVARMSASAQDK